MNPSTPSHARRARRHAALALAAALFAAPCFAQEPGFVARPKRPAFPFDGTIVSIDRDEKNAGDIGMEAGVVVGGLVGLGVGRVVELFDPPEKDEFLPPRIAGALGGAVLGGFFGGELQKERFPRLGRHWRATVAPSNGATSVSVDLGPSRGPWKTNQLVRVVRDRETGIISLSLPPATP